MPLFWIGLSFTIGILSAWILNLPAVVWPFLAALSAVFALLELLIIPKHAHPLRRGKLFQVTFGLLVLAFAIGGWRFYSALPNSLSEKFPQGDTIEDAVAFGRIISDPDRRSRLVTATIRLERIATSRGNFPVSDLLALRMPARFHLEYGDELTLIGDIEPVLDAGEKQSISYTASQGIVWQMDFPEVEITAYDQGSRVVDWIYHMRERAYENIFSWMPFPENALLSGILLGIDWNIPKLLTEAYRATNTIHIIAISGFNIAVIAGMIMRLFRRILPTYWDGAFASIVIVIYTIMVGADPAVTRAAVMGIIAIPAYFIGRRVIGINLLTAAAAFMLVFNPLLLWNISFQLSYLATLGMMTLADPLNTWIKKTLNNLSSERTADLADPVVLLISSTLAAQFAVLPVLYRLDQTLKPLSLPANLLILPLQPPLMIIGGLAVLTGFHFPSLGALLAKAAWLLAALSNRIAMRMSLYPRSQYNLPEWVWVPAASVVFAVITWMSIRQIRGLDQPIGDGEAESFPVDQSAG